MTASFIFIVNFRIEGAIWRAVFVAALAVSAFALVRYWQSLARHSRKVRYTLVGLRGITFFLMACALAGVRVEYDARMPSRVLIYQASSQGARDDASALAQTEATTRLIGALREKNFEVVEQRSFQSANISGPPAPYLAAMLVTDGAMRADEISRQVERASATAGGAPVYVLTDFAQSDSPRVSLNSITVMNRPARGVPLVVRCQLHARGMRGRVSLVTIADDAQVRVSAEARWTSDDEQQDLTLEVVPKAAGWINYTARVEASGGEDEKTLSRPFTIYAEERRQRVLFFEGEPTWEAKFVRRALEEAELFDVDYFAQVSRAAVVGTKEQASGAQAEEPSEKKVESGGVAPEARLRAALSSATRLNAYDCIIVGATPDAMLSNAEASRLREWVERRGGGLIVLGGNSFAGSVVAPNGKLYSLLPAEIDSSSFRSASQAQAGSAPVEAEKTRGAAPLTPTRAGAGGALRGFMSASADEATASLLTGQGFRLGALRAGASVLAVGGQAGEEGTSEVGAPLIAATRDGAGRTLVFAPADSWRIQTGSKQAEKGGPFAALWQGLALWAATGARPPVEIVLNDESPAAGSEVTAEIRTRDETYAPLKIEKLNARLQPLAEDSEQTASAEVSSQEMSFTPDLNDPSIWRARFIAPAPGRFNLDIAYTASGKSGAAEKYFASVPPSALAAGSSPDTLRRAARATGGDLFVASNLNLLTEKLAALPRQQENGRRTWELRAWWPLALIIPLLLSGEWLIKRMKAEG